MINNRKYPHLKYTLLFSILGLFIGGFTAIILLIGQEMIKTVIGNCEISWNLWIGLIWVLAIVLPLIKYYGLKIKRVFNGSRTWLFNLIEYVLLQGAFTIFWTDSDTFCKTVDGQNGIEFIFTSWLSLPILIGLNYIYDASGYLDKHLEINNK